MTFYPDELVDNIDSIITIVAIFGAFLYIIIVLYIHNVGLYDNLHIFIYLFLTLLNLMI